MVLQLTCTKCRSKKYETICLKNEVNDLNKLQDDLYRKGYIAGYRDGIRAADSGKAATIIEKGIVDFPVEVMGLSTRACNCLSRAGCANIADVVVLSDQAIAAMRNMGAKTASEIAHWLDDNGICYSAWSKYL